MEDVAIFAALGWEARAVLAALAGVEPGECPGTWRGYLGDGASCRVVRTGMGWQRAAAAAERAPSARLLLACGCAGALVPGLNAGTLVAATSLVPLDRVGRAGGALAVDGMALVRAAAGRGLVLRPGAIATAPAVLETPEAKAVAARAGAIIVDMESGAVAAVARRRGAAFQALRVVLDEADQGIPRAALAVDDAGEVRLAATLARLTPRPWCWPEVARLARQRAVAERRLRLALGVLLGGGLDALGLAPAPPAERQVSG
jgi:nucleoside phosphorylase